MKFRKSWTGTLTLVVADEVEFFIGRKGTIGIGIEYDYYDRTFMLDLVFWFMGVTKYHKEWDSENDEKDNK